MGDEIGKKKTPEVISDLNVVYYTDEEIKNVKLASPDYEQCKSRELPFEKGSDEKGNYITFHVNSLEYWSMVYMEKE